MRNQDQQRLEAACRGTAKSYPSLQKKIGGTPSVNAKDLEDELVGFLGAVWKDRRATARNAEAPLQALLLLFDVALLQACDLAVFSRNNLNGRPVIWSELLSVKRPTPNEVFYILAANLSHSMQAFRLLLSHGFESQARNVFRGVVEFVDLLIVILSNEDTYREYTKSFEDEKTTYQHWRKRLSPGVIRDQLSKIEAAAPIPVPVDMTPDEIRRDTYSWLSRFVHNDYVAHIMGAHPADWQGYPQSLAMLGDVGETSRATLANALMYLWISLLRLDDLLWEKHGWKRFRQGRSRARFHYRSHVLNVLFDDYLPTYWQNSSG